MIADHYSDAFLNGDSKKGESEMTDEDRQKLIARLRDDAPDWTTSGQRVRMLCDEIEWLAAEFEAKIKMRDEKRQELCATLRRMPGMLRHDCIRAANEIERLAEENSQLKDRIELLEHEMKYGTDD
jgi:chromosome segregation ATPase